MKPLIIAVIATALSSCSSSATINQALLSDDGITLRLGIASCNADLSADVDYTETEVTVNVTAANGSNDACLDSVTIELDEPVGGRAVIDGSTGQHLAVESLEE